MKYSRRFAVVAFAVLVIGTGLTLVSLQKPTQTKQNASALENLNTGAEITFTQNADGTMGPSVYTNDFSNKLPAQKTGQLTLSLVNASYAPLEIKSLQITIWKAEVHLISLAGISQPVDYWETLDLQKPQMLDMMELNSPYILGSTTLADGEYNELRLYVSSAKAVLLDGESINPSILGNDKIIRIAKDFTVTSDNKLYLTITFDANRSLLKIGNTYLLRPIVTAISLRNQ